MVFVSAISQMPSIPTASPSTTLHSTTSPEIGATTSYSAYAAFASARAASASATASSWVFLTCGSIDFAWAIFLARDSCSYSICSRSRRGGSFSSRTLRFWSNDPSRSAIKFSCCKVFISEFAFAAARDFSARSNAAFALAAPRRTATICPFSTYPPLRILSVSTIACAPPSDGAASLEILAPGTILPTHATASAEPESEISAAAKNGAKESKLTQKSFFIFGQLTARIHYYNTKKLRTEFACPIFKKNKKSGPL